MKLFIYKKDGKLYPCTSEDKDKIGKMPVGEPCMISYTSIRNPRHHRLYMKFIDVVYQNVPESLEYVEHPKTKVMVKRWPTKDNFRKQMEMYAGYYEETVTMKGELQLQPKSIRYEKLDETAFSELHTNVKNVIGRIILPEMDMETVEQEIEPFY